MVATTAVTTDAMVCRDRDVPGCIAPPVARFLASIVSDQEGSATTAHAPGPEPANKEKEQGLKAVRLEDVSC
jgi:hypothetical protein